jgi:plasmid stabilization system protein ParE
VSVSRPAQRDYFQILDYLIEKSPKAAEKFEEKFDKILERLENSPFFGKIPNYEELRTEGYRMAILDKYLVFYIVKGSTVEVHRIIHGARDYLKILRGY